MNNAISNHNFQYPGKKYFTSKLRWLLKKVGRSDENCDIRVDKFT